MASFVQLPQDILDAICQELYNSGETPTLAALALVARPFLDPSRRHLYRDPSFTLWQLTPAGAQPLTLLRTSRLLRTLDNTPCLVEIVKSLAHTVDPEVIGGKRQEQDRLASELCRLARTCHSASGLAFPLNDWQFMEQYADIATNSPNLRHYIFICRLEEYASTVSPLPRLRCSSIEKPTIEGLQSKNLTDPLLAFHPRRSNSTAVYHPPFDISPSRHAVYPLQQKSRTNIKTFSHTLHTFDLKSTSHFPFTVAQYDASSSSGECTLSSTIATSFRAAHTLTFERCTSLTLDTCALLAASSLNLNLERPSFAQSRGQKEERLGVKGDDHVVRRDGLEQTQLALKGILQALPHLETLDLGVLPLCRGTKKVEVLEQACDERHAVLDWEGVH
ncbi:hypothetical protein JCM11641_003721 [Rhodosporidiobolus odoratus]